MEKGGKEKRYKDVWQEGKTREEENGRKNAIETRGS